MSCRGEAGPLRACPSLGTWPQIYTLWWTNIAIENGHLYWIFPLKMVIFHCYVSSPEGIAIWMGIKYYQVRIKKLDLGISWASLYIYIYTHNTLDNPLSMCILFTISWTQPLPVPSTIQHLQRLVPWPWTLSQVPEDSRENQLWRSDNEQQQQQQTTYTKIIYQKSSQASPGPRATHLATSDMDDDAWFIEGYLLLRTIHGYSLRYSVTEAA